MFMKGQNFGQYSNRVSTKIGQIFQEFGMCKLDILMFFPRPAPLVPIFGFSGKNRAELWGRELWSASLCLFPWDVCIFHIPITAAHLCVCA